MNRGLVSVITPAYNSGRLIQETIGSVRAQTYRDWEMVIVDDCSTDGTREVLEREAGKDPRITVASTGKNSGQAAARNLGMKVAKGRYLAFLDADDLWLPRKLERQVEFMRAKGSAFSFTSYRQISEDGKAVAGLIEIPGSLTYRSLLANAGIIGCLTVVLDRERLGAFEFQDIPREDFALWLGLLRRGFTADGLREDLARYRVVTGSHSSNKIWAAVKTWDIIYNLEKTPLPFALWCFARYGWKAFKRHRVLLMKGKPVPDSEGS